MSRADAVDTNTSASIFLTGTPFHGKTLGQLYQCRLGGVIHGAEKSFVGDKTRHTGNKTDAALCLMFDHGPGHCVRRSQDADEVDVHHFPHVIGAKVDGWLFLLDRCGGDAAVEATVVVRNVVDELPHAFRVADVLLLVDE